MCISYLFPSPHQRLERDHGRELVEKSLALIASTRAGIRESELIEALEMLEWKDQPQSNFSRLYTSLKTFVTSGGAGLLQLFHQQLLFVVQERYIPDSETRTRVHRDLASFFLSKVDPTGQQLYDGLAPRALSEVCHHLTQARDWSRLQHVFTSLHYIAARCQHTSGYELIHDFLAAEQAGGSQHMSSAFEQFKRWFVANGHILVRHPDQTVTLAAKEPSDSAVAQAVDASSISQAFVQWVNKSQG